ncbi:hypothetical protein BegalDRAFT_1829 [Beggiatoa alba B18LD]|uniref:DUF4381 domain-containing protein n=1 Tax=Beggiatoa alba B18LD TaxID=395493 RepID=I3CGG0_9GAMM|nr:DUF4381 domain-containing protein [Beggiatoa alba]EIJ42703.1 hypothetical protein BegalDRAFT_1829 [Beggiatoa alba B18LD]
MDELRDIRGLSEISWFPLANGWLIVLSLIAIICFILIYRMIRRYRQHQRWQWSAYQIWQQLNPLTVNNPQQLQTNLQTLNILLKRVAIQRYGRAECAGLTGQAWLVWLTIHDPKGFNWQTDGNLLQSQLYASPEQCQQLLEYKSEITAIYHAVGAWIEV